MTKEESIVVPKPEENIISSEPEKTVSNAITAPEPSKSEEDAKQTDVVENTTTTSLQSTSEIGFGNTAVIQVQDSGNGTSLETLMANAMLSSDGNFVFMAQTEDGQVTSLPPELNLSEVISAGSAAGQAFFIETPEGLVACTAANEDGAIQLIPAGTGDIDTAVISSAQSSGNLVENQLIQAISGGQAMAYTFTSNSGCLELTPVSTPQTQTPPSKPTRGRCGRPPKSRTINPISSMGQTILLQTDSSVGDNNLTVSAKPMTPTVSSRGRGRGGGRGGRTPAVNTALASNATFSPTSLSSQQLTSSAKSVSQQNESQKSGTTGVNSLSALDTSSGPSQLAASRRTYSKKSNIVWITPDPSQTTNSSFSTVATTSTLLPSKPSSPTKPTTLSTTISSPNKNTPQSTTTSLSSQLRSTSPSKAIASTTQTNTSITLSKAMVSTPSSNKTTTATVGSKSATAVSSVAKTIVTTISKTTVPTTTASKTTTAGKISVQLSPTKVTTTTNKSTPISKAVTSAKSTIKVSDITATKTTVSTTLPKTIASATSVTKPVVSTTSATTSSKTVASTTSAAKTITSTISTTKTTASTINITKPITSTTTSNKTVASTTSSAKPIVATKATVATTASTVVSKPIVSTSSVAKTVATTKTTSKTPLTTTIASKTTTSVKSPISTTASVKEVVPTSKLIDSAVKTTIATKSKASTVETITPSSTSLRNSVSKSPIIDTNVSVTESSRLSPNKMISNKTKIETKLTTTSNESTKQQIVTKIKIPTITSESAAKKTDLGNSEKSKVQSTNKSETNSSDRRKSKTSVRLENEQISVTNDLKNESENQVIGKTGGASILAHKSSEEIENEVQVSNKTDIKSSKKSKRHSKTTEESKKEKVDTIGTDIKTDEKKSIEKTNETPIESNLQKVTTRRTSRKRENDINLNDSKTEDSNKAIVPTTPTTSVNSSVQIKSGRVTRGSAKKTEEKASNVESHDSKAIRETSLKPESVTVEGKPPNDLDKKVEVSKTQSTPESNKTVLANSTETITSTRSVKKKVQFEIKDNKEEEKAVKTIDKIGKALESNTPISTRRSLRSSASTPVVENKINVIETDKKAVKEIDELLETSNKTLIESSTKTPETSNKTPQRFSTRKRKEVPKPDLIEPEVKPSKTMKKTKEKSDSLNQVKDISVNSVNSEEIQSDSQTLPIGRVRRDRKSRNITRIETKLPNKEPIRHSIETSEPTLRQNKRKSFVQSFINDKDSKEKEENVRRKTISSLSDLRSPNECYDYFTNECSFYIRCQSASLTTMTPKQSGGNYLCQKCGYHTSRINNLVIHHKDQCPYAKNAVIQQWQTELQKRVKSNDSSYTPTVSKSKPKKRKIETNSEPVSTPIAKTFDEMDGDSDEEQSTSNSKTISNEKTTTDQNPTISDIDAMLMGSDDEDLLSIDNIENPKREFGFAEDDIVWVETHNLHWPALVSKVHLKERKASIKFIDGPWSKKW